MSEPAFSVSPAGAGLPTPQRPARSPRSVPKNVLIVDDHPQVGDALAEMLRVMGHTAHHFSSAAMSVEWLENNRPDLGLLDLSMPGTNGVDLLIMIRDMGHSF